MPPRALRIVAPYLTSQVINDLIGSEPPILDLTIISGERIAPGHREH